MRVTVNLRGDLASRVQKMQDEIGIAPADYIRMALFSHLYGEAPAHYAPQQVREMIFADENTD